MKEKRAVILAGGRGTRLQPYTIALPKPLVPVGNIPVMEIIIMQLKQYGFTHITLAVNHMSEIIKAFFGDGAKWDIRIDYSEEEKPLGTMGPLRIIEDLPDNFLVMNGDVITDLDFSEFFQLHIDQNSIFTISSYERNEMVDYGVIEEKQGLLSQLKEKPKIKYQVSMGIYMVSKIILEYIPEDTKFGFDALMESLLSDDKKVHIKKHNKYWLDIGRPSDYEIAIQDFESKIKKFLK